MSARRLAHEISLWHLEDSTAVIVSAKHGQSPTQPAALTRIEDGAVLDGLDPGELAAVRIEHTRSLPLR